MTSNDSQLRYLERNILYPKTDVIGLSLGREMMLSIAKVSLHL